MPFVGVIGGSSGTLVDLRLGTARWESSSWVFGLFLENVFYIALHQFEDSDDHAEIVLGTKRKTSRHEASCIHTSKNIEHFSNRIKQSSNSSEQLKKPIEHPSNNIKTPRTAIEQHLTLRKTLLNTCPVSFGPVRDFENHKYVFWWRVCLVCVLQCKIWDVVQYA